MKSFVIPKFDVDACKTRKKKLERREEGYPNCDGGVRLLRDGTGEEEAPPVTPKPGNNTMLNCVQSVLINECIVLMVVVGGPIVCKE